LGNPPYEDCRALETANGAAGYFPLRVLYFTHTRQAMTNEFTQLSRNAREKGKKKANAFGLAWPPIGVFYAPVGLR
jgi:hypothetical protein